MKGNFYAEFFTKIFEHQRMVFKTDPRNRIFVTMAVVAKDLLTSPSRFCLDLISRNFTSLSVVAAFRDDSTPS